MPSPFPDTRWTLLLSARADPAARGAALDALAHTYWSPLYTYLRRRGLPAAEAEDAVQGLFERLLTRDFIAGLSPERGRLRGYLKAAADHYLANERARARAQKRGGAQMRVDLAAVEATLALDVPDPTTAFDRDWARAVLDRVLGRLRAEQLPERLAVLDHFFGPEPPGYAGAAAEAGMSVPQLKSFLHRARQRYRALILAEIAETLADPTAAEDELRALLDALKA